jgi:hypothetical protein
LQCLQDCVRENKLFRDDLKRLKAVAPKASSILAQCSAENSCAPNKAQCCR